ncbi:cupin domain-containing protein [Cystobacter fuscus]|uniref:cupin domain-containing protein n=1 Tax=Cystobacter fuscus TaxID=43 RepID=UPI0037C10562
MNRTFNRIAASLLGLSSLLVAPGCTHAHADGIVFKNQGDLTWEQMLPELGGDSPRFSILRVDPETQATTLMIEFPQALYIPKHTHRKSETHVILGGAHVFEYDGQRFDVKEHGYIYMPGTFVHEAWVPAGSKAVIILEDGWKVDWLNGGPGKDDVGKGAPGL